MPNYRHHGGFLRREDLRNLQNSKKAKNEVSKSDGQYIAEYTCCQSSSKKLKAPIVISRYGKLYNKEAVIEYLINKPKNQKLEDITGMKDFWTVEPSPNPSYVDPDDAAKSSKKSEKSTKNSSIFPFACPITGLEMNGRYKFVFGLESKAIVSEQAVRECNMALFPAKYQAGGKTADMQADELHPLFDPKNEDQLMCPLTNKKFGRPIQCYPTTKAEKDRAREFTPVVKEKKKKKKKSVSEEGEKSDVPEKKIKKQDSNPSSGSSSKMASPMHIPKKLPKAQPFVKPAGLGRTPYHDAKKAASLNKNKEQEGVPSTPYTPARGGEGPSFNRYR